MNLEGKHESQGEKMTPEKMVQEIQSAYPTSHAFLQEVLTAGKDNWATSNQPDVQSIIIELAQHHRSIKEHRQYINNIEDPEERENKMYERGLWLGGIVSAVYYGELTMIDKDGNLLKTPEELKKN